MFCCTFWFLQFFYSEIYLLWCPGEFPCGVRECFFTVVEKSTGSFTTFTHHQHRKLLTSRRQWRSLTHGNHRCICLLWVGVIKSVILTPTMSIEQWRQDENRWKWHPWREAQNLSKAPGLWACCILSRLFLQEVLELEVRHRRKHDKKLTIIGNRM